MILCEKNCACGTPRDCSLGVLIEFEICFLVYDFLLNIVGYESEDSYRLMLDFGCF